MPSRCSFSGDGRDPARQTKAGAAAEPAAAREQAAGEAEYKRAWEARQAGREEGGDGREERERGVRLCPPPSNGSTSYARKAKASGRIAEILEAEGVPFPPGRYKKWNHGTVGRLIEAAQERIRQEKLEQAQERERKREQERECDEGWKAELQLLELQHERHALEHQRLQLELERLLERLERRAESPSGILPPLLSAAVGILAGGVMVMTMLYQPPPLPLRRRLLSPSPPLSLSSTPRPVLHGRKPPPRPQP